MREETFEQVQGREWEEATIKWQEVLWRDPNLKHDDLHWYSMPALLWLGENRKWRKQGELDGFIDGSFEQPAASTSIVRRMTLLDGSTRVIKELYPHHQYFYTTTPVAQALTLAGEQAIGWKQFGSETNQVKGEPFYQGIYSLEERGDSVRLTPYDIEGDGRRVVGVMREVDSKRTLGLLMFSEAYSPSKDQLRGIYSELAERAMRMKLSMTAGIRGHFSSANYIQARIDKHTPGQVSEGKIGTQFEWLKDQATAYVDLAKHLVDNDNELRSYLLDEDYARRGGDVRAINTILNEQGSVEVVLDQINLFLNPVGWGLDRIEIAPWGMNSQTYEMAFLIPDLVASGNNDVAQTVVDVLGRYNPDFKGERWDDLRSTPIRVLRFWTAMKAIETAGLSTFRIDDYDLGNDERGYLMRAVKTYGGIAVGVAQELEATIA